MIKFTGPDGSSQSIAYEEFMGGEGATPPDGWTASLYTRQSDDEDRGDGAPRTAGTGNADNADLIGWGISTNSAEENTFIGGRIGDEHFESQEKFEEALGEKASNATPGSGEFSERSLTNAEDFLKNTVPPEDE